MGQGAHAVAFARRAMDALLEADQDTVWALTILGSAAIESPMPLSDVQGLLDGLTGLLGVRPTVRSELIQAQAMVALLLGDAEVAWKMIEVVRGIERDLGRRVTRRATDNELRMLAWSGRFAEVAERAPQLLADVEASGHRHGTAVIISRLALAQARLGQLEPAHASALAAYAGADRGDRYEAHARSLQALAEVHLARGDLDDAVACAQQALASVRRGDFALLEVDVRLSLARALASAGDAAGVAVQVDSAAQLSAAKQYAAGAAAAAALA